MDKRVVIVILVFVTAVCGVKKEYPPWFEWVNTSDFSTGYCACSAVVPSFVYCNQIHQVSYLMQGSYNAVSGKIQGGWCLYLLPDKVLQDGRFPLPANISELNTIVCGNLTREMKGPLCGRYTGNTGPSVYSVGSRCVHCSPVNILYYLLLQYRPSTLIFLLIIVFRPNITSAPMVHYVLYCNFMVFAFRFHLWLYNMSDGFTTILEKISLTLSGMWSFDALIVASPPLCISQHLDEINVLYL